MTSSNTLLKKIIGVKDVVVTDAEIYSDHDGVTHLTIDARPNSWNRNKCPFCGRKKLPGYDRPSQSLRVWRGLDFGGVCMIFKSTDADKAETELNHWLWWASHSRIPVFHDLYFLTESRGIDDRSDTQKEWSFLPTETTEEPNYIVFFV